MKSKKHPVPMGGGALSVGERALTRRYAQALWSGASTHDASLNTDVRGDGR